MILNNYCYLYSVVDDPYIQKQHDQVKAAVGKSSRRRSVRRAFAMTSNDGVDLQAIPQGTEPV